MSETLPPHRQAVARQFIVDAFDDNGFEEFCFDYFPAARHSFASAMGFSQKVIHLLDWCVQRDRFEELIVALKAERPERFPPRLDVPPEIQQASGFSTGSAVQEITVAQAETIAAQVKTLSQVAAAHGSYLPFQPIYAELRAHFSVASYKRLRQNQYEPVLAFLAQWQQRLSEPAAPPRSHQ